MGDDGLPAGASAGLRELAARYPWIPWGAPIRVQTLEGGPVRWACRVCIARRGLRGEDSEGLFPTLGDAEHDSAGGAEGRATMPELAERTVTLQVSTDTVALWDALQARLDLESFDHLVQILVMYGAFLVASAELGYLEGLTLRDLTPDRMRAVFVPWLRGQRPAFEREG